MPRASPLRAGTGNGPARFHVGDPLWANSVGFGGRPGTAADFTTVAFERFYRLPAGVDPVATAAAVHSGATAYLALHPCQAAIRRAGFHRRRSRWVVTAALVQAVRCGARVIASWRASDVEHCLGLGTQLALDYSSPTFGLDLSVTVEKASGGRGVEVHLETSGRHQLDLAVDLLALPGRIIVLSGLAATGSVPLGRLYTKNGSIRGFAISNATALNRRMRRPASMGCARTPHCRSAPSPPAPAGRGPGASRHGAWRGARVNRAAALSH